MIWIFTIWVILQFSGVEILIWFLDEITDRKDLRYFHILIFMFFWAPLTLYALFKLLDRPIFKKK